MNSAVLFALGTTFTWGLWLVLADLASDAVGPVTAAATTYAVAAVVVGLYALLSGAPLNVGVEGRLLSVAAGLFAAIGLVSLYVGLSLGSTAVVSTVGALYFVVAAFIGVLVLGDPLSPTRAVGIGLAVVSIVLISW
ncbi:EamA family transporter [Salinirubellus sp. GCM10025818]|uniref:EamA family transporter n=1 Tax=Salinirubellus TaxID=2162630 RepID=UPI0030CB7975